ncbi:hypothetical protein K8T06_15885, partial [bacterium]|nr:hypothetical protein [bacterium]
MFYDPNQQKIILFGGIKDYEINYDDTWSWDGTTLTELAPAHSPQAGEYIGVLNEYTGNGIVMQGCSQINDSSDYNFISETWEWTGTDWNPLTTTVHPQQRQNPAMMWDVDREVLVLFGGYTSSGYPSIEFEDTWEFDGTAWTEMTPVIHPPDSDKKEADMVYDRQNHLSLLVTSTDPVETWSWDGTNWTQLNVSTITCGFYQNPKLAYDTSLNIVYMVAGDETYTWDGSNWQIIPGSNTPTETIYDIAFDESRSQLALIVNNGLVSDLYLFDGVQWGLSGVSAGSCNQCDMVYDPGRSALVFMDGWIGLYYNGWIYVQSNGGWFSTDMLENGGPVPHFSGSLCATDTGLYYFGGNDSFGYNNELWSVSWLPRVPALNYCGVLLLLLIVGI